LIYRLLFKIVLQRIDAEEAHCLARYASRVLMRPPPVRWLLRRIRPRYSEIQVEAFGLTFPSPVGVAAGMDKEVDWFEELGLMGFGFVEVGTVTAEPQEGAPRPRVARETATFALRNWMGFPNPGAAVAARRLSSRTKGKNAPDSRKLRIFTRRGWSAPPARETERVIVGSNIGKTQRVSMEEAAEDYRLSTRQLGPLSDYVVLNVSSPNTPHLKEMQAADRLRPLVKTVRDQLDATAPHVPLLVKISPDLDDCELDAICDLSVELALDGIVAVNTTENLGTAGSPDEPDGLKGGLSGRPLKARALDVVGRIRGRVGDRLVLISVGGIETPDDAWERILSGATLVQAHTGFVYGGPFWPHRMNRGLARRVRETGKSSIQDLIGAGAMGSPPAPARPAGHAVGDAHVPRAGAR
jgi:dihydroorotate dehydrogenase